MQYELIGNPMTALGLTLPRVIGAFLMLPLITSENMPALVRNSFLVSLAIVALPVALAGLPAGGMPITDMAPIILKELFLGIALGFCFGIVFWAIGAAGNILDTQIGMSMASIMDPIQGHQSSLHGQFLSQLAGWLFMASGAFLIFLDLLMSSYAVWPVTSFWPHLQPGGMAVFVGQFGYMMTAALLLAAPAMVILLIIDVSFGLVNRYAPSLNVFALTLPIKAWLATAILLLLLGTLVEFLIKRLGDQHGFLELLQRVFG
ncbi:type III secretion system export apparatus subunit SctT [Luteimonas aquatica]|uniref:type III secretion system export apparatus subunit SctT n=1 Tax=Luteimonas aquatica TaxID=450364 RepID=UPI001F5A5523|nr:type III secretion system export apparatus subunit SctT [Luteimonas aquatica]